MARPDGTGGEAELTGSLIRLIGEDATFTLLEATAGTRFYVPKRADAHSELARIVGRPVAKTLAAHYGGETLKLPLAKPWRALVYHERGLSYADIARKIGCNESTVFKHLQRMGLTGARPEPTRAHKKSGRRPGRPRKRSHVSSPADRCRPDVQPSIEGAS